MVDVSGIAGECLPRRVIVVDAEVLGQLEGDVIADETNTSRHEHVVYQTRSVACRQGLTVQQSIHSSPSSQPDNDIGYVQSNIHAHWITESVYFSHCKKNMEDTDRIKYLSKMSELCTWQFSNVNSCNELAFCLYM